MTNPEVLVDTIQHGKKQFIKKFMKHPELSQAWNQYVDAQSIFVKQALKTNETTSMLLMEIDWFQAGWDSLVKHNSKK